MSACRCSPATRIGMVRVLLVLHALHVVHDPGLAVYKCMEQRVVTKAVKKDSGSST